MACVAESAHLGVAHGDRNDVAVVVEDINDGVAAPHNSLTYSKPHVVGLVDDPPVVGILHVRADGDISQSCGLDDIDTLPVVRLQFARGGGRCKGRADLDGRVFVPVFGCIYSLTGCVEYIVCEITNVYGISLRRMGEILLLQPLRVHPLVCQRGVVASADHPGVSRQFVQIHAPPPLIKDLC